MGGHFGFVYQDGRSKIEGVGGAVYRLFNNYSSTPNGQ